MALKLNIRWQLALVSVALSLLPIAIVGIFAYQIARGALEERIRFNLETLAVQSDEKLERLLLDQHQNLAVWSQLGFVRDDAVTGDADGRIQQFLQEAKRNTDVAQELWVANAAGTVIASTLPTLRGREVGDREFLQAARRGEAWVGSPMMQDLTGRVGMPLAFPLQASFDRSKPVGVLVAVLDWPKILATLQAVRVLPEGQDERGYLVLADSQGMLLAAPPFLTGWEARQDAAERAGSRCDRTRLSTRRRAAATIEVRDATYLVGLRDDREAAVSARCVANDPVDAHATSRLRRSPICCGPSSCCRSCSARSRRLDRCTGRLSFRVPSCRSCRS